MFGIRNTAGGTVPYRNIVNGGKLGTFQFPYKQNHYISASKLFSVNVLSGRSGLDERQT